jgi:hypothetical protein
VAEPFEVLEEQLLRAGVAPRHVKGYLMELSEHLDDLTAEEETVGCSPLEARSLAVSRLGDADTLARAMISRPELRSWAFRAPWAVFVLIPVVAYQAITILTNVAMMVIGGPSILGLPTSEQLQHLWYAGEILLWWISPIAIGCVLASVAARQKLRFWWPVLGPVLVAIAGSQILVHINPLRISFFPFLSPLRILGAARVFLFVGRGVAKIIALMVAPYAVWRLTAALLASRIRGATS